MTTGEGLAIQLFFSDEKPGTAVVNLYPNCNSTDLRGHKQLKSPTPNFM